MSDSNTPDVNTQAVADSSSDAQASGQTTAAVPLENRVAELNRKFQKFEKNLDDKFSQLISSLNGTNAKAQGGYMAADKAPEAAYADNSVEAIVNQTLIKEKHRDSYQQALQAYPELNPDSDQFDEKFHKIADSYYKALASTHDPEAPLKAIRLAAVDVGRFQQVEREKLLADEIKRTRTLGEGSMAHRSAQKQTQGSVPENVKGLAQLLKVDLKQIEDKYKNPGKRRG